MDFEEIARRFLYPFYVLGFNLINPRTRVACSTLKTTFFDFIPTIFYLVLVIILFAICVIEHIEVNFGLLDTISFYLFLSFEGLLNIIAIIQAIIYRKKFRKLHRIYVVIDKYLRIRMRRNVEYDKLHGRLCRVIVVLSTAFACVLFTRKIVETSITSQLMENVFLVLNFLSLTVQMHTLVHLEVSFFFLMQSTQWLHSRAARNSTIINTFKQENVFLEIRHFKYIHFQLWKISKLINHIFGWSVTLCIFRNLFELALSGYWTVLGVIDHIDRLEVILRKSQ